MFQHFLKFFIFFIVLSSGCFAAEKGMPQLDPKYWLSQIFWVVIIFSLLLILVENTDTVSVNLLFHTFEETKVAVLILISVGIGVLIGYGLTVVTLISAKSELRSIKQKNQSITNELNDLRNVAIDQDIYDTENDE